jgi:selenocysteine-specific elongation factor
MKNIIVGTAGHIDHGKTALVKALTGIDADRLEEEKRRGITIDIGFAHLQLTPRLRLGFVDVPGHDRFVKNMLAGASGIDLALFVIAADESIKPQTREHFEICRLLGIGGGVIALTKADLVDADLLALVRLETEEFVAASFLAGAAIVPVSAATGEGLGDLRRELAEAAGRVPEKNTKGYFRLPIDRSFSMKGFGTVVTGTLVSGQVRKEQEVELHPGGRVLRVRNLQVYGAAAEQAHAGERTALNLADIEATDMTRGMTLTAPRRFQAIRHLDVRLELLASAKPLKHRAPVHFHAGAAEIEAEVRLLGGAAVVRPGETSFARIVLREPALVLPGDRFIVRMFSPVTTIGGGTVIDISGVRRPTIERLQSLAAARAPERVALLVREAPYGLDTAALVRLTGLAESEFASPAVVCPERGWFVDRAWFHAAVARLTAAVRAHHRSKPLEVGIPKQDLRAKELPGAPAFLLDALLAAASELALEGEIVKLRTHQVVLQEDEEHARAAIERAFERAGLATPALTEVLAKSVVEAARARSLLQILLREKRLVRVSEELVFHRSALDRLRGLLAERRATRFNVGAFKDWTGISRKYAIPLLEYLDREHVTRREGDERVVL